MKSGSTGGRRAGDDDDADEGFETRQEPLRPPLKGEHPPAEFDEFDEEDFDDEFDDDFEEELEDEYELSEFEELTEEDLAEDEEADVTTMGDFVDEDAEPEEPALEPEEGAAAEAGEEGPSDKKKKKKKGKGKGDDFDDED
jgi:hypothetical protein